MNFGDLIKQKDLVQATFPDAQAICTSVLRRSRGDGTIRIMYGETYDRYGPTLDSLKYYFFVAALGKALREQQMAVEPRILIADVAACRNEPEDHAPELLAIGQQRASFVRALSQLYGLDITVKLMSEYLYTEAFQARLESVRSAAKKRSDIDQWIHQTVPASKVDEETGKGFAYAYEEIATILEYDLKVGPPREQFYDEPARLIGPALGYPALQSIYLHQTFPLGLGREFFLEHEDIEQYGVTAYKAGSKNLAQHRVILGQTTDMQLADLLQRSFVSKKPSLPNPVVDVAVIAEMAQQWLQGEFNPIAVRGRFFRGGLAVDELRSQTLDNVRKYVLEPIRPLLTYEVAIDC